MTITEFITQAFENIFLLHLTGFPEIIAIVIVHYCHREYMANLVGQRGLSPGFRMGQAFTCFPTTFTSESDELFFKFMLLIIIYPLSHCISDPGLFTVKETIKTLYNIPS